MTMPESECCTPFLKAPGGQKEMANCAGFALQSRRPQKN